MYTYKIFDSVTKECEEIFNTKEVKFDSTFFQHIEYIKEITKYNKSNLKIKQKFDRLKNNNLATRFDIIINVGLIRIY
mgnify:CR=1 FL=1